MTDDERNICKMANSSPRLQSLLYDLNLLPEQTLGNPKAWAYTVTVVEHMNAALDDALAAVRGARGLESLGEPFRTVAAENLWSLYSRDEAGQQDDYTHQEWAGMDGAVAWHLIERHADSWSDVGKMMNAWLSSNKEPTA